MIFSFIDWIFLALGLSALLIVLLLSFRYTPPRASEVSQKARAGSTAEKNSGGGSEFSSTDPLSVHANFRMGFHSIGDFWDNLSRLSRTMGLPIGGFTFIFILLVLAAVCTFFIGSLLQPNLFIFIFIFAFVCYAFYEICAGIAHFRARRFEEQLEQVLTIVIGGLKSGLHIQEAVKLVSEHSKGAIRKEFLEVYRKISLDFPIDVALAGMVERYYSEGVYLFVCAVSSKWMGSNDTIRLFASIQSLLRDRRRHSAKLRSQLSGARVASFFVAMMPYGLLVFFYFFQPDWVSQLFNEPLGRNLLFAAIGVQMLGLYWVQRQLKIQL